MKLLVDVPSQSRLMGKGMREVRSNRDRAQYPTYPSFSFTVGSPHPAISRAQLVAFSNRSMDYGDDASKFHRSRHWRGGGALGRARDGWRAQPGPQSRD